MLNADTVAGFVGSMLQKSFDGAVESPDCHYEWWTAFCDPNPFVAIAAPRAHAKSTALTFGYTLTTLLFRERSYAIIVSDTVSQAVQFLGDMKRELFDNEQIKALFKIKCFVKDSEDDVIVACEDGHMFRIQAKGSEQKVRGLKWNNKRPDLIVCDDLENDEIVLNKERREKFRKWFYGALLPCRSANGIVRYVGTILHADSLLERLMPKLHDRQTVIEPLKTWSKRKTGWKAIKYKAHTPDFKHILWEKRFNADYFVSLRNEYIDQGLAESYSQEYLNIPIDESVSFFKRTDFLPMTAEDKEKRLNYYVTGDLAISKEEHADFSVFVIAAVDQDKMIYIKNVIKARMDGREIVDTILDIEKLYEPDAIGIEEMQVSKAIGPFLREEMVRYNIYPNLIPLKHAGKDKPSRARSMQGRMRAHRVKFDKAQDWYQEFEDECVMFPRSKHDDQFDAFAYLGMLLDIIIEAPTKEESEEEEYLDELDRNYASAGRNSYTGY